MLHTADDAMSDRYLLFAWDQYYPSGGSGDEVGRFETLDEARHAGEQVKNDSWEILDRRTGEWME